jgi:hypothetical protein
MQSAKEEVQKYTSIARNAICSQAFHSNATAYLSQTETTLNRYSPGCTKGTDGGYTNATNKSNTSPGKGNSCFGCGGSHYWMRNKIFVDP